MSIAVGRTRSGRVVSVSSRGVQVDESNMDNESWALADHFDVHCIISRLVAKEQDGWELVIDGSIKLRAILRKMVKHPKQIAGVEAARRFGLARTISDDLDLGRRLLLPEFREKI